MRNSHKKILSLSVVALLGGYSQTFATTALSTGFNPVVIPLPTNTHLSTNFNEVAEVDCNALKEKVDKLTQEHKDLTVQVKAKWDEGTVKNQEISKKQLEIKNLKNELAALQLEYVSASKKEKLKVSKKITAKTAQIGQEELALNTLKEEKKQIDKEWKKLKADLATKKSELDYAVNQYKKHCSGVSTGLSTSFDSLY